MSVTTRGPIFDGRARRAAKDYCDAAEKAVADEGVDAVRSAGAANFRNSTGAYVSGLRAERRGDDSVITDGGSRYGPWLAGTSARNASSSFGGYDHWEQATADLQAKADAAAERVLPPFLAQMG